MTTANKSSSSTNNQGVTPPSTEEEGLVSTTPPSSNPEVMGTPKKSITRIYNATKALHYVGDLRILPDDVGSEFSDNLHEQAMKNVGYAHLISTKQLRVE